MNKRGEIIHSKGGNVATYSMPDGDPEHGWCHNGDPCRDGSGLECLTKESDDYSLRRNHTERDIQRAISGAGAATLLLLLFIIK